MPQLVGSDPSQTPPVQALGRMAFSDPATLVLEPPASVSPHQPGSMVFELTSDTTLTVRVRGRDGVLRSATIALA